MLTKVALIGIAHFLMQADPVTAQNVLDELSTQESEQVIQIIEQEEQKKNELPEEFREKAKPGGGTIISSPSTETCM